MAAYAKATMTGHPAEPETFEFSQTSSTDGRVRRRIKSFVTFDDLWPAWRIHAVRLLVSAVAALSRKDQA